MSVQLTCAGKTKRVVFHEVEYAKSVLGRDK